MSRRSGRYQRRQEKRRRALLARTEAVGGLGDVFTYSALYQAGKDCCRGVRWKNSTQRFELRLFSQTAKQRREVLEGAWKPGPYHHFTLSERGKIRPIDAPNIRDRQVHKVYTRRALLPLYRPSMIHNNGASLPGKGFDFSQNQLKRDLRRHFRKYGRDGWIILLDFSKFFPSADHGQIYNRHQALILNDGLRRLGDRIVATIPGGIGLPLGVEPSQAEMVAFPSALDNTIKCQLAVKGAGHYMDDYYLLVPPDRDPHILLDRVMARAADLHPTIHRGKTRIQPLTKPFGYCKTKFILTERGRIITHGNRGSLKRDRRKIKAFHRKVETGEMTYLDLWSSTSGMLHYFDRYNDHRRVLALRRLFYRTFGFSCERYTTFQEHEKRRTRCNT